MTFVLGTDEAGYGPNLGPLCVAASAWQLTDEADVESLYDRLASVVCSNLAEAGLSFDDVVEMTTYHVDLRKHLEAFIKVKDEHVSTPYPAWTAIGVSELITEGTLVEIRIIARRQ